MRRVDVARVAYPTDCEHSEYMDEILALGEETGAQLSVQRLGFVHENYFVGDSGSVLGKTIYEVSFYFYMEVPEDFAPRQQSFTEDGRREYLAWVSPDDPRTIYPAFFRTELGKAQTGVRHIVTDERE